MTSILSTLKDRREQLVAENVTTLPVPVWTEPTLQLRIRTVEHTRIKAITARFEHAPTKRKSQAEIDANAALVVAGTIEVIVGGHPPVKLSDPDLLEGLGLDEEASGADVIKALVVRDGDIIALAEAVMRHSGYTNQAIEETLTGE